MSVLEEYENYEEHEDPEIIDRIANLGIDARARSSDPDTSHEAAGQANTERICYKILQCLVENRFNFQNAEEISELICVRYNSVSPMLPQLERKGLAYREGKRSTSSTRLAYLWGPTPLAIAWITRGISPEDIIITKNILIGDEQGQVKYQTGPLYGWIRVDITGTNYQLKDYIYRNIWNLVTQALGEDSWKGDATPINLFIDGIKQEKVNELVPVIAQIFQNDQYIEPLSDEIKWKKEKSLIPKWRMRSGKWNKEKKR